MLRNGIRSIFSPLLRNRSIISGARTVRLNTSFLLLPSQLSILDSSITTRSFSKSVAIETETPNKNPSLVSNEYIEEGKIIDTYEKFNDDQPSLEDNVELQGLMKSYEHSLTECATKPNNNTLKKVLLSVIDVGDFYFSEDRLGLCVSFFEDSLKTASITIKDAKLDIESAEMAIIIHKIGCVYAKNESPTEALKWLNRSMDMKEKVFGTNHPEIARTLNTMGMIYESAEDDQKAFMLYQRAEAMTREGYADGGIHPQRATICENMAQMCRNRGDYNGALDQYEKLLDIKKTWRNREMCSDHDIIEQHLNVGDCLFNLRSVEPALKHFEAAKKRLDQISDKEYTKSVMAVISYNIGLIESRLGNHVTALEHLERSLCLKQETVGKDHVEVAETHNSLGAVHAILQNKDLALENFNEALRIFRLNSTEGIFDGKILQLSSNIRTLESKFSEMKQD